MYYIGVDLGTSAMKLLLMDAEGKIHNTVTKEYPLEFPQPGWSQQAPEDWRKAVLEGIPELLQGFNGADLVVSRLSVPITCISAMSGTSCWDWPPWVCLSIG